MRLGIRGKVATVVALVAVAVSLGIAVPAVAAARAGATATVALPDALANAAPADLSKSGTAGLGASSIRWIGAPTTGVPAGTPLTVYTGDLKITTPGTVIDGMDIRGLVYVQAPNVTIKNSIVRGRPITSSSGLVMANVPSATNLLIEDSELAAADPSYLINGIMGANFTLLRVNIHDVVDSVHIFGDNVTVQDSWLHGNLHYAVDPSHSDGTHDDSVQIQNGNNITLTGNYMTGAHNAAIMVTQDTGVVSNLSITGNFLDYGSCTINIANKNYPVETSITVASNIFGSRSTFSRCAVFTQTMAIDPHLSANSYADGSAVVQRVAS